LCPRRMGEQSASFPLSSGHHRPADFGSSRGYAHFVT
jgi:hypothetical protein